MNTVESPVVPTTHEKQTTTRQARYVRFTTEEYEQISEDERRSGKGVQDLLKKAYFGNGRIVVLMTDEDKDKLMSQIMRIGNNVNQIAKRVNSGFAEGFSHDVANVRSQLTAIMAWLTAKYNAHRA